eukprot:3443650-Amphidinium_carterae.1
MLSEWPEQAPGIGRIVRSMGHTEVPVEMSVALQRVDMLRTMTTPTAPKQNVARIRVIIMMNMRLLVPMQFPPRGEVHEVCSALPKLAKV